MKSEIVKNFPFIELTILALVIFITFFVLTSIRTFSAKNKNLFTKASHLPLEEGDRHE